MSIEGNTLIAIGYIICFLYFLYTLTSLLILLSKITKAKNWIPVSAILKDARVLTKLVSNEKELLTPKLYFFARYSKDKREFGCSRVSLYSKDNAHATKTLKDLEGQEGQEVIIFSNPERPHESVLIDPKAHRVAWSAFKVIFLFAVMIYLLLPKIT